jgi:DegV family protein with EDD domain
MSKIAIVTDSTANIPPGLCAQHAIFIAPQVLIWGDNSYEDGVDITPAEFYERLATSKVMPSTSQVTPSSFSKIFKQLIAQDYQVLALLISDHLSGTISSAQQALEDFPGAPIEIVDSKTVSMAEGLLALATGRAIAEGATLAEAKKFAEQAREQVGVVFAVDTLEFLHRGGRIGGASRFLGTALNIKPILEVVDGRVEAVERVRTRAKSINRRVVLGGERAGRRRPLRLAALHANAEADAHTLLDLAVEQLGAEDALMTEVSPVIGTHAGPGTVGLAYMFD